jgi:hypothetical protein
MTFVLIIGFLLLIAVALAVTLGAGPILLVLLAAGVVGAAIWLTLSFVSGRTPAEAVRRTKSVEHLGPGGPDDPRA